METSRYRALTSDGGPLWFKWNDQNCCHNLRLGGAIRKKWRILNGKVGERSTVMFRAPKVVAPTCVDYGPCWLILEAQALIMYWHIQDLWGPTNLVASTVTELEDTHGCLSMYHVEDLH
jgi:hypothetical protein